MFNYTNGEQTCLFYFLKQTSLAICIDYKRNLISQSLGETRPPFLRADRVLGEWNGHLVWRWKSILNTGHYFYPKNQPNTPFTKFINFIENSRKLRNDYSKYVTHKIFRFHQGIKFCLLCFSSFKEKREKMSDQFQYLELPVVYIHTTETRLFAWGISQISFALIHLQTSIYINNLWSRSKPWSFSSIRWIKSLTNHGIGFWKSSVPPCHNMKTTHVNRKFATV